MNKKTDCLILPTGDDAGWDCPCCERPMPTGKDRRCHCGVMVSHHLSVPTLCRRLRDAQQRESSLIVRNKKLDDEVNEQARLLGMSGERECDLRGELERVEHERNGWKTAHDVLQKLLGDTIKQRDEARGQLAAERSLVEMFQKKMKNL